MTTSDDWELQYELGKRIWLDIHFSSKKLDEIREKCPEYKAWEEEMEERRKKGLPIYRAEADRVAAMLRGKR